MTKTRPKNRKDQILTVALELLQTKGYESFSYQDLSEQLGITKASIHHHFPKKSDLGVALCESIHLWHQREYQKALAVEGSNLDKLDFYINTSVRKACGDDMLCPVSSLQADVATLPEEMLHAVKRIDELEIDFMQHLIEAGRASGEFNFAGSSRAQAMLSVITYKGAIQYARLHGKDIYQETILQLKRLLTGSHELATDAIQATNKVPLVNTAS